MSFPTTRLRRLRYNPLVRNLVRETRLDASDFILPIFVRPGRGVRNLIGSMPGHAQISPDRIAETIGPAIDAGVGGVILFGIPDGKDARASQALTDDGIVSEAVWAIRRAFGSKVLIITDECLCEYTDHGHCGILSDHGGRQDVDNDATLPLLVTQAVHHAQAGADIVAPSGMMDGMVAAIRTGLDAAGFHRMPILSYAVKYASAFYGPFREAAESPPQFGDRSGYQMDPANAHEALREAEQDLAEGADMIMVKPAMAYLDIVRRVKDRFQVPLAAYNVSGEYAMVKAAAERGWIDERKIALETLTAIKRAGADVIITYHAVDAANWLKQG